jgi:HD-like signal output (HDOD) protein
MEKATLRRAPARDARGPNLQLSSVPAVLLEAIRLAANENASLNALSEAIMRDAALSARALALANSPFFGQRRTIESVDRALVTIGLRNVRTCLLTGALMEALKSQHSSAIDMKAFWQESLLRANIASAIAANVDDALCSRAYLVSLLADVAVPLLAKDDAAYAQEVNDVHACQVSVAALEQASTRLSHARVASELCDSWGLPSSLAQPIGRHHELPAAARAQDPDTLAWQIAYVAGNLPLARLGSFDPSLLDRAAHWFDLGVESLSKTIEVGIEAFAAQAEAFTSVLPDDCSPEAILELARSLGRLRASAE